MLIKQLLYIDIKTLIAVLFWTNAAAVVLNLMYWLTADGLANRSLINITLSKTFQALAFLLVFFRGNVFDILSVNIGNSFLFVGFYAESLSIFEMLGTKTRKERHLLSAILILSIIAFNVSEAIMGDPSLRVAVSSICVVSLMLIPSISMIRSNNPETKVFERTVGFLYLSIISLLLPRIVDAFSSSGMTIFTNNFIQSGTFLSLILLDTLGNCMFLIIMMKNNAIAHKTLASTDFLTKLPNRHCFLLKAEEMFENHKISGDPITIIFFDLDMFKKYNDNYGHSFGDKILVAFSEILSTNLRECDLLCRYGGEEFIAILGKTTCAPGEKAAKRILDEFAKVTLDGVGGFTFSAGVASGIPASSDSVMHYINISDSLMYKAKKNGRNRIEFTVVK